MSKIDNKLKEKRVSLFLEIYGNYEVVIIITNNIKKSRKKLDKAIGHTADISLDVDGLHSYAGGEMRSYILLNPDSTKGVIAHESFHCVLRVMRLIGAKLKRSSEESYAYLLTHIVDNIESVISSKE